MKISTYPSNVVQMFDRVNEKNADKHGGSGSNAFEQNKKDKEKKEEFEATIENVQKAIEDFSSNQTNKTHGISATQEGNGPGLKVTLRDSNGGVLRSVSGEEFLKLREAISAGSKSGRILDQKV
jgi:uncharacterized protein YlxW (UPF0749 family)